MDFVEIQLPSKPMKFLLRGPTGAGKTFNALHIAVALAAGKEIAFLDSESGRGQMMARVAKFKYASLSGDYSPAKYIEAMNSAVKAGFGAIVLDSLTQAWNGTNGVLDQVNARGGNSFTDGWGKVGGPLQNKLMDAIITCPIPVVCTVRSKMSYEVRKDERGKSVPTAVGLAPEQRDNLSYEFDFIIDVAMDHEGTIAKMPPIEGLELTINPSEYAAFVAKILTWMTTGVNEPQTWNDIKVRLQGDTHRTELAKQMKATGTSVSDAWAILEGEVVSTESIPDNPVIPVSHAAPANNEITWGAVMSYATENDKGAKEGQRGILVGRAKAERSREMTPDAVLALLRDVVAERTIG